MHSRNAISLHLMTSLMSVALLVGPAGFVGKTRAQQTEAAPAALESSTQTQRLTPEILWKMGRLGGGTVSPDGKQLAYTVRNYSIADDKGLSSLHILDLASGMEKVIVEDWPSISDVQWVAQGEQAMLFFTGKSAPPEESEEEGGDEAEGADEEITSPQAWSLNVEDGATVQLTSIKEGVSNLKVSPTGTHIAFTTDVKMDKEVSELYEDLPKADARIIDSLMYRHWNAWHDYKYTHLHVAEIGADGKMKGDARDMMNGIRSDCPVPPFGGSEQFNWSPDGQEIAFTMKIVEDWAESTDSDVYTMSITGTDPPKNITKGQEGYDNNPVYSPDGTMLAYQSMERPSFEADRNRIMLIDRASGGQRELTAGLDQTTHDPTWSPDSRSITFSSEHRGTNQLFTMSLDSPAANQVSEGRYNWSILELLPDGKSALVSKMNMLRPKELSILQLEDGVDNVVTHVNDSIYENLELPKIEERWVDATDGKKIHCWVITPPDFDPAADKKWPMLTYFQGGPQGQIGQWFSFRWNFHMMAANGYVVVAPNRRGLPGFGQAWNDEISGDWGGQAMQDLLSATDAMTNEPYIDNDRVAGIGASFGGYTAYWMMGNHNDRFKAMIAHCGVYNLESMYGSTEELFFVNWDLGGPYWSGDETQAKYDQFSPHKFVKKWSTPLLVIHGEKDFRVPVTQGMEAFTAAQVQDVPSRFLYFPNEGHWVMSPQNSIVWFRVFFDWLDTHCKNGGEEK